MQIQHESEYWWGCAYSVSHVAFIRDCSFSVSHLSDSLKGKCLDNIGELTKDDMR